MIDGIQILKQWYALKIAKALSKKNFFFPSSIVFKESLIFMINFKCSESFISFLKTISNLNSLNFL